MKNRKADVCIWSCTCIAYRRPVENNKKVSIDELQEEIEMEIEEIDNVLYEKRLDRLMHLSEEELQEFAIDAIIGMKEYKKLHLPKEALCSFILQSGNKQLLAELDDME